MYSLSRFPFLLLAIALTAAGACGSDEPGELGPVTVKPAGPVPEKLSTYNLFRWDATTGFEFNERVVPYDLNTTLFSDFALKQRAIYVPDDAQATFDPEQAFGFPTGSVIIKNFYFAADHREPERARKLVETRLMVRADDRWLALPYIWNDAQTDAVYSPGGDVRKISFIDETGAAQTSNYLIPTRTQCEQCHVRQATPQTQLEIVLVGVKARHLNRDYDYGGTVGTTNQLARLGELGMLADASLATAVTPAFDFRRVQASGVAALSVTDLNTATRSYLDINCAHCHNDKSIAGITSQLWLDHTNTDTFRLGYCKPPGSAGSGNGNLTFDIVPGSPDMSIMFFRMDTTQVGAMMPQIGRSLRHPLGSELLHAWIASLPPPPRPCATR